MDNNKNAKQWFPSDEDDSKKNSKKNSKITPFTNAKGELCYRYKIPVGGGMTAKDAEAAIAEMLAAYKHDVSFNDEMGTILFNGEKQLPFTKEIWFINDGKPFNFPESDLIETTPSKAKISFLQKLKNLFTWNR